MPWELVVARAARHDWEEPCISGTRGAGAVFFSGCNLRCVYCQNYDISALRHGERLTVAELRALFAKLEAESVHNLDLVTPTHFALAIREALDFGELDWIAESFRPGEVLVSLMSQYTPNGHGGPDRRLSAEEYARAVDYMRALGILDGYTQDPDSAESSYTPDFNAPVR